MDQIAIIVAALADRLPLASTLQGNASVYALVSAAHILSIGILIGAVLPLDLAIIGARSFHWAASVTVPLKHMTLIGFVGAVLTGSYLFSVRSLDYLHNPTFLIKMAIISLAGLNLLAFSVIQMALIRRLLASISLTIWLAALVAGRLIGFT